MVTRLVTDFVFRDDGRFYCLLVELAAVVSCDEIGRQVALLLSIAPANDTSPDIAAQLQLELRRRNHCTRCFIRTHCSGTTDILARVN